MPLYEYQCEACHHRFEKIQKFSDPLVDVCPVCGGVVKKLFSSPAFQFKGTGFYATDYKKSGSDSGAGKSSGSGSSDSSSSSESSSSAPASTAPAASTSESSKKESSSGDSAKKESSSDSRKKD
ncbi:MAG: zinc ribbon domain-containing protein [Vicinamibacterales bacterium]